MIALVLALAASTASVAGGDAWLTDYATALKQAKEQKKVILADFTGSDWCGWCIKLNEEVFAKDEFAAWARKNVVLLELDFPQQKEQSAALKEQNSTLKEKFGIEGFPTIVFIDAEGNEVGRSGYVEGGPKAWIKEADAALKNGKSGAKSKAAGKDGEQDPGDWITSFEDAKKRAKKEKKPILADFTGSDWCGWCIKLDEEVFGTPDFKEWAAANVVLLKLDFPRKTKLPDELAAQNKELAARYGIRGYPTILFLDAKGEKIDQSGYLEGGPSKWIPDAEKKLGIKSKKKKKAS